MKYRNFAGLSWQPSALGFGCMRLPTTDGVARSKNIDEAETCRLIRHAVDQGVNYIDTAYGYHEGRSESVVGKALQDGYRQKVKLASKLPTWLVNGPDDFDRLLNEQLARLQTPSLDFYLFHALDRERWQNVILKHNLLSRAEAALRDGRIRHLGFSFHGEYDELVEIVEGYSRWEFCQIQYNYMDIENQAGTAGLKFAASRGLGVIVMEPLLGGRLSAPPADVLSLFAASGQRRSPSDWALQWVWNHPEVSLLLSGMSTMEQLEQNLVSAGASGPGSLSGADLEIFGRVRNQYLTRSIIPCTACSYCMPCPNGVDIPEVFRFYNNGVIYDKMENARADYRMNIPRLNRADKCVQCRICEEKCPQSIRISEWMVKAREQLDQSRP